MPATSEPFRIGLLGHGTVGSAFARLLPERAAHVEAITGLRPELTGVLTRSRGDFDDILERSDLIVELMGGLEPARDYVLRAMRAGRHVVTANKQLLRQHGEELWAAAREHGVQLRFEGAVAGVVPVIRVLQESLAAAHVERVHGIVNGTTNFILTEMAAPGRHLRGGAGRGAAARLRGGRPDRRRHRQGRRRQDGDPRPAGVRHAGAPRPGALRGHRAHHRRRHGLRARARPRPEADRHRRARRRRHRVRVHPAFLYAGHPLASVHGPFNAVTVESEAITEITMSGPGAGGPQTASAVLGDVISAMIPPASTPETTARLAIVEDVESAFYLHMEVADRPGVLAQVAEVLGLQGASIKSVVQQGPRRRTRGW